MKKIITIIAAAFIVAMAVNSCSVAKNMNYEGYVEEGTGMSIVKDKAYEVAVSNALIKITKAHDIEVNAVERQRYSSSESTRGKNSEQFSYESQGKTEAKAQITEYKVVSAKYSKNRINKKWTCNVVVSVPFENVR